MYTQRSISFAEDRGRVPGEQEGAAGLRVRRPRHPGVQPPPAHLAGLPALPEDSLRGLNYNYIYVKKSRRICYVSYNAGSCNLFFNIFDISLEHILTRGIKLKMNL